MQATINQKQAAWEDPDDKNVKINISSKARLKKLKKEEGEVEIDGMEYQNRLQSFYRETLNKTDFFSWASDKKKFETSNLRSVLNSSSVFESNKSSSISEENVIEIKKLANINAQSSVVQSIDFHPKLKMMITCGYDKIANIFRVYGPSSEGEGRERAPKSIKKVYTERFPLTQASFLNDKEILFCGKGRQLLNMDLETGVVEEVASKMWMEKMGTNSKSFSFSPSFIAVLGEKPYAAILDADSKQFFNEVVLQERATSSFIRNHSLYISGASGTTYLYDIRNSKLVSKLKAEGCGDSPIISSGKDYFAVGGSTGIVNIYSHHDNQKIKEISNLTTAVTSISLSDSVMCINSKWKPNSARLLNLKNMKVFKNWPASKTRLSSISACKICSHDNFIAYGNEEGNVVLYWYESFK